MYIVLEVQKNLDGTGAIVAPIPVYNTLPEAESCWHSKLAYACISSVPVHTVKLIDDDANVIRTETYIHKPTPAPEPEPQPEPEPEDEDEEEPDDDGGQEGE